MGMPDQAREVPKKDILLGATNAQLETRVKALETWRISATATIAGLVTRIAALEAQPASTVDLAPLTARVAKLETTPCAQQTIIDGLVSDHQPAP